MVRPGNGLSIEGGEKMTKRVLLVLLALSAGAVPAAAAPVYGTAGCGLGSVLFGAKPGFMQVFAATTNVTAGNQTFGITSGTSNCDKAADGSDLAKIFIEVNRESIARDSSRGAGETVVSLAAIAGCADPAAVGAVLQRRFGSVFPDASVSSEQVSEAVVDVLKADSALACTNLST
jgi:hypothetical protein